jgi:O-antigen/teichoic acid export membrane protein
VWGSEGRGLVTLIITNISLVNILTNITSGSTVSFHASKINRNALMLINGIGAFVLSMLGSILSCFFMGWKNFWICFLISLLIALSSSFASYFLGKGKIHHHNTITLANPLITVICITIGVNSSLMLPLSFYFYSMAFGLIASIGLGGWFYHKEKIKKIDHELNVRTELSMIMGYGFRNELSYLFQFLCFRVSYFVISEVMGIAVLGIFSVAVAIVESIWVVSRSFATVHYSEILSNTHSAESTIRITHVKAFQSFLISSLFCLLLVLVPSDFYGWIFGRDFTEIKKVLMYLIPGCLMISFSDLYGYYFAAVGRQRILIEKSVLGFFLISLLLWIGDFFNSLNLFTICMMVNGCYVIQSFYLLYHFRRLSN